MNKRIRITIPDGEYVQGEIIHHVRFGEADPMGILWHGRYWELFERAREQLWNQFGLTYAELVKDNIAAPLAQTICDNTSPLMLGEQYRISCRIYMSDIADFENAAAKLHHYYFIYRADQESDTGLLAKGYSLQVFTETSGTPLEAQDQLGEIQLRWPTSVGAFLQNCRADILSRKG